MRIITALLPIVALAIAPVLGNTEILNLPSHPLCSPLSSAASQEALEISRRWPVLRQGATPNFVAIEPHSAVKTDAAQGEEGHWFRLALPKQGAVLQKGWTIRASWPANHHVSLGLDVYTPKELLQLRSSTSQLDAQHKGASVPCSTLYLHLSAEVEGVPIPPSPFQEPATATAPATAQVQLHPALRLLSTLASWYLDPLSATPSNPSEVHLGGEETTLTPVHLTLEPLLFGVAPRGITLHLLGVLVVILAGLGTFIGAGGVEIVGRWAGEVLQEEERKALGEGI